MIPLLQVTGLTIEVPGPARAVDDVDLDVHAGETVAIIGESGSGKSLLARAIADVLPESAHTTGGHIHWRGRDILTGSARDRRAVRGREIGFVPQDVGTALDPSYRVGVQITEGLRTRERMSRPAARTRAVELLTSVGLPDAAVRARDYPHRLSIGQRQRVLLAAALAQTPALLVADEPTSALDPTIAAEAIDALRRVRDERGAALVIVTHDLGAVAALADRVAVMYAGRIVERSTAADLFTNPQHPYTQALLAARPEPGVRPRALPGSPPDIRTLPAGCAFHPRCPNAREDCRTSRPPLISLSPTRAVACPYAPAVRP